MPRGILPLTKRIRWFALLTTMFCFGATTLFPQSPSLSVELLDVSNGLSQGSILSTYQDQEGFIWFGTYDGLNCYNGKTFKVYHPTLYDSTSLSSNYIKSITEDLSGKLYVGTISGLSIRNRNTDRFTTLTGRSGNNVLGESDVINAMLKDHDGKIWIAANTGLFIYDPSRGEFIETTDTPVEKINQSKESVLCLYQSRDNSIWAGTMNNGVFRIKDDDVEQFQTSSGQEPNPALSVYQDLQGDIWIGTMNGILHYGPKFKRAIVSFTIPEWGNLPDRVQVTSVLETSTKELLAGTKDHGLFRLNRKNKRFESLSLYDNSTGKPITKSFMSIFEDRSGVLWLGTSDAGIAKIKLRAKPFLSIAPDARGSSNIFSLLEDSHRKIWIGTRQGITIWDRVSNGYEFMVPNLGLKNSLSDNRVWGLEEDRQGFIWIGTSYGLNRYDPAKRFFSRYLADSLIDNSLVNNDISCMHKDLSGLIWIGTTGGLSRLDPGTGRFHNYRHDPGDPTSLSSDEIMQICSGTNGRIWIATQNGLNLYQPEKDAFQVYKKIPGDPGSLSHNFILSVYENPDGTIWVGTNGYGLDRFDPGSGKFTNYSIANGLPNNTIYAIRESKGALWLSTNNGLTKLDLKSGVITVYNARDGIPSNEFNAPSIKTHDGLFMFGTVKGVLAFYPDSIQVDLYQPPLVFTDLKINNASIRPGQVVLNTIPLERSINQTITLSINHRIKEFTIEFASLEYTSPEKIKYSYKIDEFAGDWVEIGSKDYISFTGLTPGIYHLYIKGTNADGIWSDTPRALKIVIRPPWWKTLLFYILAVLVAAGLTVLLIRYRTWKLKRDKDALEQLVKMRTIKVESQNKEIKAQKEQIEEQNALLERHRERLEELIEERTKELIEAKDRAEESDRLKTAFLQNLHHEVRTPLNAIMGFSELLNNMDNGDEEKISYTEIILASSRQLLSIMNNILTISSLEKGLEKLDKNKVNIVALTDDLVLFFKAVAAKKELFFTVKYPSGISLSNSPIILTDEYKLQQIFIHLISNALKFTSNGGVEVGFVLQDDAVEFYVKDTGIGIHPDLIDRIFDRFRKGENLFSPDAGGTGLGLSISKAYVELLGGKIWVTSEPEKGSTFFFSIPQAV